jgi:hypothetical protein
MAIRPSALFRAALLRVGAAIQVVSMNQINRP